MFSKNKIRISMTESGDPLENAVAERINGILKTEWLYVCKPDSWKNMLACVSKVIGLYNNQRPRQSIGYMVPALVHQTGQKTERKWESYYRQDMKGFQQGNGAKA
jgi:transposase InsO family protein